MADLADIAFDFGGDGSKGKEEKEFEIDLCNDFFADDKSPPVSSVDLPEHYEPPVYTVIGTTITEQQKTSVRIMPMEDASQPPEDEFEFECPSLATIQKLQNNKDDDGDFDFDSGVAAFKQALNGPAEPSSDSTAAPASRIAAYTTASDTTLENSNINAAQNNEASKNSKKDDTAPAPTEPPSHPVHHTSRTVTDKDVKLSFKASKETDDGLSNLLSGLQGTSARDEIDEFDFDSPQHNVHMSAVNEVKEDQLEEFTIQTTQREVTERKTDGTVVRKQETVTKYTAPTDPTAILRATGLLPATTASTTADARDEDSHSAEDEWAGVREIVPGRVDPDAKVSSQIPDAAPLIPYTEALSHVLASDLNQYKPKIQTTVPHHGFSAIKHFIFGPPKLHRDLWDSRDHAFCLAACQLDNSDPVHIRVLQTVYRKLTGSKFDCQRFGGHWEQIGFQGNDPATDLRGCGMLGLIQLVYLVTSPSTSRLAADIYKLSLHVQQNFPFCIMGINMTRMVIQALREEILNKDLNKRKDVFGLLNDYYVAIYYHLYHIWKTQHKTIAHTGFVIKEVESFAKKKPNQILKNLETYLAQQKSGGGGAIHVEEEPLQFSKFE